MQSMGAADAAPLSELLKPLVEAAAIELPGDQRCSRWASPEFHPTTPGKPGIVELEGARPHAVDRHRHGQFGLALRLSVILAVVTIAVPQARFGGVPIGPQRAVALQQSSFLPEKIGTSPNLAWSTAIVTTA